MIKNKEEYKYYLECDRKALDITNKALKFGGGVDLWKFEKLMRKYEYYANCKKGIFNKIIKELLHIRYKKLSILYGFSIPINSFGPGLRILHRGTILINGYAKIGKNCRINVDTVVGAKLGTKDQAPTIGDNCFIGPGAKIFGKINIGDNVAIGANAVVTKDVPSNCTVVGIPAKKINNNGTKDRFKYYIQD